MASPLVPAHLSKTCRAVPLSLSEILDDPCLLQTDQLSSIEELDPYPATVLIKDWASPNIEPKLSFRWATNQYRRKIVDNTYDYYPTSRIFHYVVTDLNAIKMPFVSSDSDLLDINYDELTSFVNQISYYFDIEYEEQKLATSKIQEVLEEIFEINSVKLQETLSNTAKSNDFNSSNDDVLIETESISDTNNISQTDNDLFTDSTINSDSDETVEDLQNNKKFIHIKTFNDLKHKYIKKSIQWSVFKSKLYKLRMKYRKLEQSIQHLENQNQGLQERFKSAVAERKQHQEARQKTQDQLTETNLKKNELEAKLPTLQEALREKDVELEILNEKNREISNSLKKTQTMLEDLSRSPDEVILENVELKQKYDESQNKLHELQALLSGKTIALNEANQSLQDSFREISILKNDLANAGEWIIPESLYDVVKAGKKYYSSKLVFHERIPSTIQAFTAGESDKKNRIVQEAVKMIKALADEMYNLKFVENNLSEQGFTDLTGIQFAMTERKITTRNKFFERMRTCKYMGQIIMFFPHLKSSIQGTEFRIHFQFLENEKKILICHIGGHIPTAGTRLNT
jgi:hypothetical protein